MLDTNANTKLFHIDLTETAEVQGGGKPNCLYTNTDILQNKMEELELFLDENKNILFIAITETLSKTASEEENINADFVLPGFSCITNNEGRGVCLFIKHGIEYDVISDYQKIFSPSIFCTIEEPNCDPFVLGVIYRSPNGTDDEAENLNKLINHVSMKHKDQRMVIVGDFNYSEIDWEKDECDKNENHISTKFLTCIQSNYIMQLINEPTHYRGLQNPTLVDLILTNDDDFIRDIKAHQPLGKSHHLLFSFKLETSTSSVQDSCKIKHQINKGDYDKMREHVGNVDWSKFDDCEVDVLFEGIENTLNEAKELYIPIKKIKNNFVKRSFTAPDTLLLKLQIKREAFKLYKKHPTAQNHGIYVKYRNEVNAAVKRAKKQKEESIAKEAKSNPKALFDYVASKTKQKEGIANLLKGDGSLTKNDEEKAQVLSDFFKSVYTCEGDDPVPDFQGKFTEPLDTVNVSEEDLEKALKNLKINKSPGPDGIHPRILKELSHELAKPLKMLFDKTMIQGKIPRQWKTAEVRPIFKKGKKSSPGNYRPVSLTSVICKLFEGFIRNAVYEHFVANHLLSEHQFGFCKGRSCVTQLLVTVNEWMDKIDNNKPVDAAYLDFRKAFDTVPHKRLITKLRGYGISGKLLEWIKDFLSDRFQYVSVNGHCSEKVPVTSGVPQGSVLGPTLFIYFINDLPITQENLGKIFADDTKSWRTIDTISDQNTMQTGIDALVAWSERWMLLFNGDKCNMLHLGKNNPKYNYTIKDGDTVKTLNETNSEKDLGVIVDTELQFGDHIASVVKKSRKISGMLMKNICHKSKDIMVPLFKALVRPHLEYANAVWAPYKRKDIDKLEKVQRQFTKRIKGLSEYDYETRLRILKLPSLEFRRVRGDLIEVFKITHNIYDPLTTHSLLQLSTNNKTKGHSYKLHKKRFNTKKYQHFFTNRVTNLWNKLPEDTVSADNINTFKNRVDVFLKKYIHKINLDIFTM